MIGGLSVAVVAARARGDVIGAGGGLPWRVPTDLARFKALTLGKPIIMGRATFASIGHGLPGRTTIVLSRGKARGDEGGVVYATSPHGALVEAVRSAQETGADEIMIAGGAQVFGALLPVADRLYLTEIDLHVAGDTRFPALDDRAWHEVARVAPPRGPEDEAAICFVDLRRIRPDTPL